MEPIQLDFEQARTKHFLFKSRLRALLYGLAVDEAPVLSEHECTVGKWIYGHALTTYGHIPEMLELEKVHAAIHSRARELVRWYKDGKVYAARTGLTGIDTIADQLMQLLTAVQQKVEAGQPPLAEPPNPEESIRELKELVHAQSELDRVIRLQSGQIHRDRESFYEVLMQLPAAISVLKGPDMVIELVNPFALEQVPLQRQLLGRPVREVLPELESQGFFALLDNVYRSGVPFKASAVPYRLVLDDGSEQQGFADITYLPLRDAEGQVEGIVSFSYDVTENVKARQVLQESEARIRFMADAMPVQAWTARADGSLNYVNQRTEEYFGKPAEQIVGEGWKDVVHPDDLAGVATNWGRCLATLEPYEVEFRLRGAQGVYRWHLGRANAFHSEGGVQWFGSNTDIHDMKLLQDQLKQSYEDLEVKVKFRNLELERANRELQRRVAELEQGAKPIG